MGLSAKERKANQRAREKGQPEPYIAAPVSKEQIENRASQHLIDLAWATEQDATGKYYRDECRSCVDLLAIYEGANILDKESDDEESDAKKKKKKKENRPNPSQQKLTIRAIETNGIKIEPNCSLEFRILKEVDEVVSFRRWLDLRSKARQNLFWLGRLLGLGLFHETHQYVCDQFVQKNFEGMYYPGYTKDEFHEFIDAQKRFANDGVTPCKELILLESRGCYKSTITNIDAIQWMINAPDARIMFITAFRHLAKKLVKEIKRYFYLPLRAEPTPFHLLFPEYILTGVDGRSETPINCPAGNLNQKEDNLWVTSIESSSTGDHCDVLKADDIVDPKNSSNEEQREELKFFFDGVISDIRDGWGFVDVTGTCYFTDDWYATRGKPNENTKRIAPYRLSRRGSWTLPPEYQEAYNRGQLSLSEIIDKKIGVLTFPYKLGWGRLRDILDRRKERSFKNQQLNEATDAAKDSPYVNEFSEAILRAHCKPRDMSIVGRIVQTWDTAYGEKRTSDFSVGVCGIVYQDKRGRYGLYILDIIFDKWKSSELSFHILQFYKTWNPDAIRIEKSNGSGHLADNLKLTAGKYGVSEITNKIIWDDVDVTTNAKRNRIKSLEFLLADDRLDFVNGNYIDEMIKQLVNFTGEKSTPSRKDDIPDALSFMLRFLPRSSTDPDADPSLGEKETEERRVKEEREAFHKRMFGTDSTPLQSLNLGAPAAENPKVDTRRALLQKIFGSNGMRA
jgi:phage terminase large subunit-like protein